MRKRRHIFLGKDSRDERWMEKYEQKKRTNVTKEMKNSTLKVNTRIRPVSCRSKWWYYRTVYTWNVMFEHSVFRFLYVRELLDRSNRSTCFCVIQPGVCHLFFSLAKLNKWNFEQNRICNYLSSWRLVVQIKTNRYREYQRGDDWWFMWK